MRRLSFPQQGFAAIAAIFLVVVLAALGGFMLTFSNTQQLTSAQDVQGSRAYWAARAGLEWAVGGIVSPTTTCLPSSTFTVDTGSVFNLTVTCTRQPYTEGASTINIFTLISVASQGTVGSIGFVERSVSAAMEK